MSIYEVVVIDNEIDDVIDKCTEQISKGGSQWAGMSYEEGVRAALDWIVGNSEDNPMAG